MQKSPIKETILGSQETTFVLSYISDVVHLTNIYITTHISDVYDRVMSYTSLISGAG